MPIAKSPHEKTRKKIREGGLRKTNADKAIGGESLAIAEAKRKEIKEKKEKAKEAKAKKAHKKDKKDSKKIKNITDEEEKLELPASEDEIMTDDEEEAINQDLPSVNDDKKLQEAAGKSLEVEKESDSKPFLSISGGPEDDKVPKVPSYSKPKNRGVIYISHIPHGFYEKQMREFFTQFGTVTNLRLGRSKKTGRSCGYAFVEFKYKEVAKVVSETMNNYLMFDKILKCSLVPAERCSPAMFKGRVKPHRPPGKTARVNAKKIHNSEKCAETIQKRQVRQIKKVKKSMEKLKKAGIDYNFKIAEMSSPA